MVRDLLNPAVLSRITVLAVVAPINTMPFFMYTGYGAALSQEVLDDISDAAEKAAQEAVRHTVEELHASSPVETVIRHGSPADEIVRCAEEQEAGLIIMGSRGWGEMHAVMLGSVSERVLHSAPCPVLIARSTQRAHSQRQDQQVDHQ
jgi:nucleotide-binding universal stress UspA family protein